MLEIVRSKVGCESVRFGIAVIISVVLIAAFYFASSIDSDSQYNQASTSSADDLNSVYLKSRPIRRSDVN